MKSVALAVTFTFAALCAVRAAEQPPIEVKNKSSFQVENNAHNPFWPIGFKPSGSMARASGPGADVPLNAFVLSTITLDQSGTRFAIMNGKTMGEGQQFSLQVGSQVYQLKVKKIEDGRVVLSSGDREVVVPLRRK